MGDAKFLERGFREMVKSDLQGGTIHFNNTAFDATIGTFSKEDVFVGAGVSPRMMADVQVLLTDLDAAALSTIEKVGLDITVMPNTGKVRYCKLQATKNSGNHISIILWDVNEKA